eukprot:6274446-Alexandrium_andersonii.AAC.1
MALASMSAPGLAPGHLSLTMTIAQTWPTSTMACLPPLAQVAVLERADVVLGAAVVLLPVGGSDGPDADVCPAVPVAASLLSDQDGPPGTQPDIEDMRAFGPVAGPAAALPDAPLPVGGVDLPDRSGVRGMDE